MFLIYGIMQTEPEQRSLSGYRMYNVLLTDDEKIVVDSLTYIIERNFPNQIRLFSALSGTEALETARTQNIDIVFMDISMPGLNGLETISRIRQFNSGIVIIILSAFDRFQYAQEAINLGAFKYLTKPVNRNLIVQTIRSAMDIVDQETEKKGTADYRNMKAAFRVFDPWKRFFLFPYFQR